MGLIGLSTLALMVAACGGKASFTGSNSAPTVTIGSAPASITAGSSSTLTVAAANASQVVVSGSDGSSFTMGATGGTKSVTPAATTTYTVTATGIGGSATAATKVTVTAVATAATVTISAAPSSITAGASSVLTVSATNATSVTITGSDMTSYTLAVTGGTKTVTPAATTTYTASAVGSTGTVTATVMVTVTAVVTGPPTVTINASPTTVTSGTSSTLTVVATNATTVTIAGSDKSSYTLPAIGGTQSVTPTTTTTYTATATGTGGSVTQTTTVTVTGAPATPSVSITASPTSVAAGSASTLTVVAANATTVTVTGPDGINYTLSTTGGTQPVSPTMTATYTATATGAAGTTPATATTTVTVTGSGSVKQVDHVIFMLQENHTFDNYFGMLNTYRQKNSMDKGDDGVAYNVDGIDDILNTPNNADDAGTVYPLFPLTSTCVDDESSDWLASYGDVSPYDFTPNRMMQTNMNGFVHNAEGYAASCSVGGGSCSGTFTGDTTGQRAMGYYDENFLNYYYYMASQFALSDRWFSPVSSKSIDNRIATFTGGTTQGLVKDPGGDDHLSQLTIPTIFEELDKAGVSWKIYYTATQGFCLDEDDCPSTGNSRYPATDFSSLQYSFNFLQQNPTPGSTTTCPAPLQASSVVGDTTNSFCIDPTHIAPLATAYYDDLKNGTLPKFAFIEAGYGNNDEHPGSGQSILEGQAQVAKVVNAFTASTSWADSVFFLAYDEGGGPFDHVPPVPTFSNSNSNLSNLGATPGDISSIAVNPDTTASDPTNYFPCLPPTVGTPTLHCDLGATDPGANPADAPAMDGFAAQLGFRVPNIVISPFSRKHYVSHAPMDHTAILKFVEDLFIGNGKYLTNRDAAQPNLLDFFDFNGIPWSKAPTPPTAFGDNGASCTPNSFAPALRESNPNR